jgi:endoplasmic reticulum chaperone BiP
MAGRSQSWWAIAFGMVAWSLLLFSPLAFIGGAKADDVQDYGTVIGIVSSCAYLIFYCHVEC